jgi:hypothetical protein
LTLHPEKTRLVPFGRPSFEGDDGDGPGTFDLLGFTHYWARSRKGRWVVKRKTASSRFTRTVRAIATWCRFHRHDPVAGQHKALGQKLRGHCSYYGITGNAAALARFKHALVWTWWKWLNRRSQRRTLTWERFGAFLRRTPLPRAIAIHSILSTAANP